MLLEVAPANTDPTNIMYFVKSYHINESELPIVEKLMQRDFKTAILNRRHDNAGIELLANDIITQRG